jgi:hypothetical protein
MKKGIFYEIPEKYKYSFACDNIKIRPIISEEKDKYLSLASAANLKKFLPKDINLEENIDLLAWAGNFCVANKINLNDDCISNEEAIRMVELLPYKFTDVEHDRNSLIGVILSAGFSEYGTDKPLTKDEIKDLKNPFNVTIGGIIWRMINPNFADNIEKMGEPDSEESAHLSWEIAFSLADLIVIDKDKSNLEDGQIISNASEISKLEGQLKAFGGTGYTDDGKRIARLIRNDLIPLGVGFVSHPAGQVGRIVIEKSKIEVKSNENEDLLAILDLWKDGRVRKQMIEAVENLKNSENSLSQSNNTVVNINNDNKLPMKITKISDLNDTNLKEVKASEVAEFYDNEIKKISDEWETKKNKVDVDLKAAQDKSADLESKYNKATETLTKVQEDLTKLVKAAQDKEKEDKFTARMTYFDNGFDLDEKTRSVVGNQIKNLSDEDYTTVKENLETLLAAKKKSGKVFDKKTMKWVDPKEVEEEKKETKASVETKEEKREEDKTVLDTALDNAQKTTQTVAATTTVTETLGDKYKKAFGIDAWEVNKSRK